LTFPRGEVSELSQSIRVLEETNRRLQVQSSRNLQELKQDILDIIRQNHQVEDDELDHAEDQSSPDLESNSQASDSSLQSVQAKKFDYRKLLVSKIASLQQCAENVTADQQLLKSLAFANLQTRHRKINRAHSDTFEWVFCDSLPFPPHSVINFKEWLQSRDGIYWVCGKPGSGKSTLMKFLCNHPKTRSYLKTWAGGKTLVTAHFFFWNAGTSLQKSQEGLLRTLLFEILRKCPNFIPLVRQAYSDMGDGDIEDFDQPWSTETLLGVYEAIVSQGVPVKFCFFIDGLDEFKEEQRTPRDLIIMIRNLKYSPDIKLCVSSRPWTVFSDEFGEDSKRVLKLENLTQHDILRYVRDELMGQPQFESLSQKDPDYASLIQEVAARAQGVFLWVALVVRDLVDGLMFNDTVIRLRKKLQTFPPDLEEFFQHLVDSIPPAYKIQAASTFKTAITAEEPLPLMLYSLLDDMEEHPHFASMSMICSMKKAEVDERHRQMCRRLDGRSRGLLEVTRVGETAVLQDQAYFNLKIDFLHRTVRDFLHQADFEAKLAKVENNSLDACRATLLLIRFAPFEKESLPILLEYVNVLFFFAWNASRTSDCLVQVESILSEAELCFNLLLEKWDWDVEDPVFVGMAAQAGLISYIVSKRIWTMPHRSDFAQPLLDYALRPSHSSQPVSFQVVEYLLLNKQDPNQKYQGETVFSRFISALPKRVDAHGKDDLLEIVRLLLQNGADVHQRVHKEESFFQDEGPNLTRHLVLRRKRGALNLRSPNNGKAAARDVLIDVFGDSVVRFLNTTTHARPKAVETERQGQPKARLVETLPQVIEIPVRESRVPAGTTARKKLPQIIIKQPVREKRNITTPKKKQTLRNYFQGCFKDILD
jgi:hypothetical protein